MARSGVIKAMAICIAVCAGPVMSGARAAEQSLLEKGAFNDLAEPIGALVTLQVEGQKLRVDRSKWEKPDAEAKDADVPVAGAAVVIRRGRSPFDQAVSALATAAQSRRNSRSFSNNDSNTTFAGEMLSGRVSDSAGAVSISLQEMDAPGRSLEIADRPDGSFRLIITHPSGDLLLINQTSAGPVTVAMIAGEKRAIASAKSFAELMRNEPDLLERSVLPAIESCGVPVPVSIHSPIVVEAVVSALTQASPEDEAAATKLIVQLDDADFATREKAREALGADFKRFRHPIQRAADDKTASQEKRFALEQLMHEHAGTSKIEQLIADTHLLSDTRYLVSILPNLKPQQRGAVVARLQQLTGESIGDDVAAWQAWAEKSASQ